MTGMCHDSSGAAKQVQQRKQLPGGLTAKSLHLQWCLVKPCEVPCSTSVSQAAVWDWCAQPEQQEALKLLTAYFRMGLLC